MNSKVRQSCVKFGLALTIVAILLGVSISSAGHVSAASQSNSGCYALKVHLNGNNPATATCLVTQDQMKASPNTVDKGCGDNNLLQLYENDNYGGARICFFGTGFANLTDYWIWVGLRNWNDEVTSYKSGRMTGRFFWDINGGTPTYYYNQGQNNANIGSTWNDQTSSIAIDNCNGYC